MLSKKRANKGERFGEKQNKKRNNTCEKRKRKENIDDII